MRAYLYPDAVRCVGTDAAFPFPSPPWTGGWPAQNAEGLDLGIPGYVVLRIRILSLESTIEQVGLAGYLLDQRSRETPT